MAKNNIRSFRYSDQVAGILEAQAGDNLNEKFDNLVRYCFERVPWVEKRLADVEKEIDAKRKLLFDVHNQVEQIEMMMQELKKIQYTVELVSRRAKNIASGLDDSEPTVKSLASAYLNICNDYCVGDHTCGESDCVFWNPPDVGAFGEPLPCGCELKNL